MGDKNLAMKILISARETASGVVDALTGRVARLGAAITAYFSGRAIADFFGTAVTGAADLQQQFTILEQVTGGTADQLGQLRAAAEAVADSPLPYSAAEAAAGQIELAKAGQDTTQVLASLPPVLDLAAAAELGVAESAGIVTAQLAVFGLAAEDSARVANVLTAGANASKTSVRALADGLSYVGPLAQAAGYSLEQTVGLLGKMADGGIDASRGGTALLSILSQLQDPASTASDALRAMGITSRELDTVLAALAQGGPQAEKAVLAFGTEAGPGLRTLVQAGTAGVAELTAKITGQQDAAKQAAEAMQNNLNGAVSDFGSVWEGLKTKLGESLLPALEREVRSLAAALRGWIASGQLEQLRTGLVATFEAATAAAKAFIGGLDLAALMTRISEFAASSKETFAAWQTNLASVGDATGRILAAMSAGWNGFRAIIETIGMAITGLVSGVTWALAQAESAAAKIGLGSEAQAAKLMAAHQAMEETARAYATAAKTHYGAAGAAFGQMVDTQTTAATAAAQTTTAAAAAQTQALGLTADQLDALGAAANFAGAGQAALTSATAAQTAATATQTTAVQAQTFEVNGAAVAVQEWNAKTGQWVTTSGQAATATLTAAEATRQLKERKAQAAAELALLIERQSAEIETLGRSTALIAQAGQARLTHLSHLQQEAEARGDLRRVAELELTLSGETIAQSRLLVAATQAEAEAARALAASLREQAEATGDASAETMKEVTAAEQAAEAKQLDAAASVERLRHQIALADAAEELARQERLLGEAFAAAGVAGVQSVEDVVAAVRDATSSGDLDALGRALKAAFRDGVLGAEEYKQALDQVKAKQDELKGEVRQASTDFADTYAQVGSDLARFKALSPGLSGDALAALTDQYSQWLAANHPEPSNSWGGGAAPTTAPTTPAPTPPPATGGSSWSGASTAAATPSTTPQVTVRLELPGNRQVNGQFSAADANLLKSMGQSFAST